MQIVCVQTADLRLGLIISLLRCPVQWSRKANVLYDNLCDISRGTNVAQAVAKKQNKTVLHDLKCSIKSLRVSPSRQGSLTFTVICTQRTDERGGATTLTLDSLFGSIDKYLTDHGRMRLEVTCYQTLEVSLESYMQSNALGKS